MSRVPPAALSAFACGPVIVYKPDYTFMLRTKRFYSLTALMIAVFGFSVFQYTRANAENSEVWVSVDQNELAQIRNGLVDDPSGLAEAKVEMAIGGIALLRLTEAQMESMSRLMHEHFHKCSGFIAHPSKDDAIASVEALQAVDPLQQFVTYTIDNQAAVSPMLAEASELQNRQAIIDLSAFPTRRHNQPTGLDSANWIKNKWTALAAGRSDVTVENYVHPVATTPQPSIVMTIQGQTLPDEIVVLGAHQDSINTGGATLNAPGADDDASGVASLTETIRVLMAKGFRPNRTVKFMAYAAEEVGLKGSGAIALDYRNQNKNVVGVVQLDMTNYKGSAFDIVLMTDFSNAAQNQFVQDLVTAYQPSLSVGTSVCGYGCSDHASWFNRGYPTSMPFESTMQTYNGTIHSINDTISQSGSNANHALKFTKLALSFVGELAKGSLAPTARAPFDFDGDAKSDISIFRPGVGEWWYLRSSDGGNRAFQFGTSTDTLTPGDFTGDGKADLAFFRPSNGEWFVFRSENATFYSFPFGVSTDTPVPADYDGDNKTDAAVFRASNSTWYIQRSGGGTTIQAFGAAGDKPVAADYDGDGKADIAIYRPSVGQWWLNRSTSGVIAVTFGTSTDKTVQGDYTGDGKADPAFFRNGEWFVLRSENSTFYSFPFGISSDTPVPGDYDGDGKYDGGVFRSTNSTWYVQRSTAGTLIQGFGANGDVAVPSSSVR
ncbi:MAG: M20/M25/M40 family metallo-hydrolase [Acidobacteria bacterium]|nr:M20/M25/M40 family metallo-hydrolase [Acidobacteriota bacterium]